MIVPLLRHDSEGILQPNSGGDRDRVGLANGVVNDMVERRYLSKEKSGGGGGRGVEVEEKRRRKAEARLGSAFLSILDPKKDASFMGCKIVEVQSEGSSQGLSCSGEEESKRIEHALEVTPGHLLRGGLVTELESCLTNGVFIEAKIRLVGLYLLLRGYITLTLTLIGGV